MSLPRIRLVEVGPRDGLQNAAEVVSTDDKIRFINELSHSGLTEIEAGAFVSQAAVPKMFDSDQVFAAIERRHGVLYSALVPNEKGLDRALQCRVDKIAVFTAASETFNLKNINATIAQSIERFKPVLSRAAVPRRVYISTAFYCPYEGKVKPEAVIEVIRRLEDLKVDEYSIGDTIGKASADDVRRLLDLLLKRMDVPKIFLHFHDTYGMAVGNALAAWKEYSISGFDASTGGIGGCPYAPGATGNVATEDLVGAFESAGGKTGVDVKVLQEAGARLAKAMGRSASFRLSKITHTRPPLF